MRIIDPFVSNAPFLNRVLGINELILTKALRIIEVLVIMKMLKLGLKAIFVEKV